MLLRTVLEAPRLRLRLLTGEQALDRRVSGIFTTDLLDPRRYLSGGELVLTGLMWRRMPEDSETFVLSLVEAGVTALAAGDAAFGSVPPDLVAACRRHGFPLLEVPVDVSFAAITEHVMRASTVGHRSLLMPGLDEGGAHLDPVPEPTESSMAALFTVAAREYGLVGWLISPVGRLLAGPGTASGQDAGAGLGAGFGPGLVSAAGLVSGGSQVPNPGVSTALWQALAIAYLRALELPITVNVEGGAFSVFPVAGRPAHRLAAWFVAFEGDSEDWDEERREVAGELTGLAAAYRSGHEERRRPRRRSADELVRQVVARGEDAFGPEPGALAAGMRRGGLSAASGVVGVAAQLSGVASQHEVAAAGQPQHLGAGPQPQDMGSLAQPQWAGAVGERQWAGAVGERQWAGAADGPQWARSMGEIQLVVRAVLEEMLPDAVVGLCGDEVVALAPRGKPGPGGGAGAGGADAGALTPSAGAPTSSAGAPTSSAGAPLPFVGADSLLDQVRAAVGTLRMGLPTLDLSLGVSVSSCKTADWANRPTRPADAGDESTAGPATRSICRAIEHAVDEARQARRLAALAGRGVRLVDSAHMGSHELLLALVPEEARRTFRTRVLGPVVAYDSQHGTELVHTLEVFLACSGSWTKAAGQMYVHVNSLRYRIRRIEELTGRDLGSLADQADLLLALRIGYSATEDEPSNAVPGGDR